jgi:ribosomal protein L12E/L44/L45/RPP1/RPP2
VAYIIEEKEGLAVTYAALILHDDGHRVTTEKLNKLLKAANVTVAPYWSALFENVLRDRDMEKLLANLPSGSSEPQPLQKEIPYIKEHKFSKKSDGELSDDFVDAGGLFD